LYAVGDDAEKRASSMLYREEGFIPLTMNWLELITPLLKNPEMTSLANRRQRSSHCQKARWLIIYFGKSQRSWVLTPGTTIKSPARLVAKVFGNKRE
jgi:hypothetical protein